MCACGFRRDFSSRQISGYKWVGGSYLSPLPGFGSSVTIKAIMTNDVWSVKAVSERYYSASDIIRSCHVNCHVSCHVTRERWFIRLEIAVL